MSVAEEEIGNIAAEYRYSCWAERNAPSCALLSDFIAVSREDVGRAKEISKHACDTLSYGPSCYQTAVDFILHNEEVKSLPSKPASADHKKAFDYFARGCGFGHAKSCYRKGQMETKPAGTYKGVRADPVDGLASLELACDKGCFDACYEASVHLLSGTLPEVEADYRRAFTLTKTACEFGLLEKACHNLAAMYENGIATKRDPQIAEKVREKMASSKQPAPPPPPL